MVIEHRNLLGDVVYSVGISLNRIDLKEYTAIEGDFGNVWEVVLIEVPNLKSELIEQLIYNVQDYVNPLGTPMKHTTVAKSVRMIVNHFLLTRDLP
jgi:hypothetical protein